MTPSSGGVPFTIAKIASASLKSLKSDCATFLDQPAKRDLSDRFSQMAPKPHHLNLQE
tara:strand:- start:382 stop:555 length:174 start_codon:yes stop_codon:yes gene_type:complete